MNLFLTDPPYSEIDRYGELAELAASKLKPGGLCLAYCGQWYLPQVLEAMSQHLSYYWTFAIHFDGPHRPNHPRHIQNTWQPVVVFSRERATASWIVDLLESGGREKGSHNHQKTLSDVEYIVEKLTDRGAGGRSLLRLGHRAHGLQNLVAAGLLARLHRGPRAARRRVA